VGVVQQLGELAGVGQPLLVACVAERPDYLAATPLVLLGQMIGHTPPLVQAALNGGLVPEHLPDPGSQRLGASMIFAAPDARGRYIAWLANGNSGERPAAWRAVGNLTGLRPSSEGRMP
jgi:hypothetical protein